MRIDWDIVDQILNIVAFFVDRYDKYRLYAEYRKEKQCLEFYPVDSDEFEACIRVWYRRFSGKRDTPSAQRIIEYIRDEAIFFEDLEVVSPYTRIAGNLRDGIEYFLADRLHKVIQVTGDSWGVSETPQHKFLSTKAFGEQVEPVKSDKNLLDLLAPIVNLRGDDLVLFALWLTQAFSCGSHYGVMLSAERGSGKSSLTRAISKLIDPSEVDTAIMQTKLEDFQNYLANHYLVSFDNVREIPTDYSDTLCAAITGSTVPKRQLFKDRDEVRLKLHNIVVMNGIDIFPKESDLAERFLYFKLGKIKPTEAKTDYELEQTLEENRPLILGCIFDLLSKASLLIKGLLPKKPTRMMDAYTEMLAIAKAMGLTEGEFHRIISNNITQLNNACVGSPVVRAVCEYMNGPKAGKRKVVETSTRFYDNVKANYSGNKEDLFGRSAEFSKALKADVEKLMKAGFGCLVDDTGEAGSTVTVVRYKK